MASSRSITVVAVVALALAGGCVSTPVSAPSDGQILLSAAPATVVLDEFAVPAITEGTTVVTARVFDANSAPQSGVEVFFSASGGELASSLLPDSTMETDDNGRITDTLRVTLADPDTIEVTVHSGTLTSMIEVIKDEATPNQAPFPVIDITPVNSAEFGDFVKFDGALSDDPDGDLITCYQWEIETRQNIVAELPCSPPSSRCEIAQGDQRTAVNRIYDGVDITDEQTILVKLRVSDDPSIACPTDSVTPASAFNGITDTTYDIVCDRTPPVADGGPNQIVSVGAGTTVSIDLNGSNSEDPESGIVSYEWNCGNGTAPQSGVSVTCNYTNTGSTNIPFQAELTVRNGCGARSSDTVNITVAP